MGRAPTSGYCHTCRRRRVKCDRGVPSCQRCLKSGHLCRGYAMPLRIVNASLTHGSQSSSPTALHSLPNLSSRPWANETPRLAYASELSLVAFKDQISLNYFLCHYTWAHWWKSVVISGLQSNTTSASYIACDSLLVGYLGIGHSDSKLLHRSMQLYGDSMRLVSLGLDLHTNTPLADLTLPVMILGMYPYVVEKSIKLEHDVGLGLVTRHCGPGYNQDDRTINMFRSCRSMLVCTAFAKRRRTFLEEDAWKIGPFHGFQKTSMDRLYDITSTLPGLAEEILVSRRHSHPAYAAGVVAKADILRQQLQGWRYDWEQKNPGAATVSATSATLEVGSSTTEESLLIGHLLDREIRFKRLDQALEIFSYNAALVYLFRLQELLVPVRQSPDVTLTQEDMHHIKSQLLARETSPLLLPDKLRLPCQPALEAVQQCAYIAAELTLNQPINFIALAPVGILYCALKRMGPFGEQLSAAIVATFSATSDLKQLEVFGIWDTPESPTRGWGLSTILPSETF
ncbi:hypothetical protein V1524DRAFT_131734 [Lipomyces starkeyi]